MNEAMKITLFVFAAIILFIALFCVVVVIRDLIIEGKEKKETEPLLSSGTTNNVSGNVTKVTKIEDNVSAESDIAHDNEGVNAVTPQRCEKNIEDSGERSRVVLVRRHNKDEKR